MTAEQLNIKINLDIANLKNSTKQVKQSLAGMTNEVKKSLPRLNKESKEASTSLKKAAVAGKEVKKSLDGIGKEAKESLGEVTTQANKMATALHKASIFGKTNIINPNSADDVEVASDSLAEMQSTMQAIMNLDLATLFFNMFAGVRKAIASTKNEVGALWGGLSAPKKIKNDTGILEHIAKLKAIKAEADSIGYDILTDVPEFAAEYAAMQALEKELNGGMQKNAWKQFNTSLKTASHNVITMIGNLSLLTTAVAAVAAVISSFGVAKMGQEIYVGAQRAGMSAQKYQEWQYVLQRVGIEAEELTEVVKTLTEAQIDVINADEEMTAAFAKLGMSMEDVTSMGQDQLFESTVAALQNVEDTTQRTAIAYKIFGEDAAKLTTLLRLTNNETSQLISTYNALGGAMSQELITYSNQLGGSLTNLRAAWQGLRNTLAEAILPVIIKVVDWLVKAIVVVNTFIRTLFGIKSTPAIDNGFVGGFTAGTGAVNDYKDSVDGAAAAVEKLKRTTMGFDELNIVGNPNAKSGGSGGAAGGGSGGVGIPSGGGAGFDTTNSVFSKLDGELENIKKKVEDFVNKWKPQIAIIGAALAALGISQLIEHLGKALGLGDKFLSVMKTIKGIAASAIVITLQYTMVNEFLDNFIDGEGFKNYLMAALVTAIGSGVLYAMWGPAGLAIGLGVTAVASIASVIENGGITNLESAIVALTGVATAIGAIAIAFKKLGLGGILKTIGNTITKFGTSIYLSISGILGTISAAITKALTVVKAAITTVIKFIIANPIALVIAAIVALVALIAVKGDEIQKLLNKVSDWIKGVFVRDWREVFGNTLGTFLNGFVKIVGDVAGNVKKVLNGIIDFIRGVFTGNWKRAWEGIKQIFGGVFGGLKALAKAPINAVITMINTALSAITSGFNGIKRILNGLSINIPDWVPKYGGKKFGFNFKMSSAPRIPMLAEGGLVVGDTLARLGEGGKREAVLPLEQNTGWMDTLADKIAAKQGSAPTKVQLIIDGKELGWATINNINKITKQTGGLQLVL